MVSDEGSASGAGRVTRCCHTAQLTDAELAAARALMDAAFDDFTDQDWSHALGGMHALVLDGGRAIAHGALVMRRLLVGGRSLRCGYVEAVAVHPDLARRGLGSVVMASIERLAPAYDLLALSSSEAGLPLYRARGWELWRGPSSVMAPGGLVRTPDEDGSLFVLLGRTPMDLEDEIACDWREGDVW
jgi:aminoglycoside 2'-N-acetyltransferase I